MAYKSVVLEDSVTINRIISVHYFQYIRCIIFTMKAVTALRGKAMTSGNWYAWTEVKLMRWQETGV